MTKKIIDLGGFEICEATSAALLIKAQLYSMYNTFIEIIMKYASVKKPTSFRSCTYTNASSDLI
jgi:hypothetical protein